MFITYKRHPSNRTPNITFQQVFEHWDQIPITPDITSPRFFRTYTRYLPDADLDKFKQTYKVDEMIPHLLNLQSDLDYFKAETLAEHYETFYIPKRSGGLRRIDAPKSELMLFLRNVKQVFEWKLRVLPHDAAYAYFRGRSTLDALRRHQENESRWFLKLDIKDFFPSCNYDFIMRQLAQIFPFNILLDTAPSDVILPDIIKCALLNNGLPQGTPLSPFLTNIIMTPLDYQLQNYFRNWKQQYFVYTRYADDIILSSKYHFNWQEAQAAVNNILAEAEAPFQINTTKTRYGSSAGRNWNLGLMFNKDNQITIGRKRKERFKVMLFTFCKDLTDGNTWDKLSTQQLMGNIAYYKKIEPQYIEELITKYAQKFGIDFYDEMRIILQS